MARNQPLYLLGIQEGRHLAGNDGTLITYYRKADKLEALAQEMKKTHNLDEVILIRQYTQRMCEMDNDTFVQHVRTIGKKLA